MFEVVLAIFIMALIITGVVVLSTGSILNSTFSKNKTLAGRYGQEATEWLRNERDIDFAAFIAKVPTSVYCLDSDILSWTNEGNCGNNEFVTGTIFKRELILTSSSIMGKNVIEATVYVYWNDAKGYHEVRSVTNFTDRREQ